MDGAPEGLPDDAAGVAAAVHLAGDHDVLHHRLAPQGPEHPAVDAAVDVQVYRMALAVKGAVEADGGRAGVNDAPADGSPDAGARIQARFQIDGGAGADLGMDRRRFGVVR